MKILITGAKGQVGSELTRQALNKNYEVYAFGSKELDIADLELDVDTLVPFGLIINELLTNTLKYAFPDDKTGRIDIHIYQKDNQLRLDFSDNGIGIDNSKQSKSSFGYKLINTLLDQLEGEMKQESVNGTQLYFSFDEYKIAA